MKINTQEQLERFLAHISPGDVCHVTGGPRAAGVKLFKPGRQTFIGVLQCNPVVLQFEPGGLVFPFAKSESVDYEPYSITRNRVLRKNVNKQAR
jgi:hypothetical protein